MSTASPIETERLFLRAMVADDLDDLLGIFGDPAVMAAFRGAPLDREQVRRWVERNLDHQREHGDGFFAVCLKTNDRLIGDCGLELMELSGQRVAELGTTFEATAGTGDMLLGQLALRARLRLRHSLPPATGESDIQPEPGLGACRSEGRPGRRPRNV